MLTSVFAKSAGKIRYYRPIPDNATIKEITAKKEATGEWFVSLGLETDDDDLPESPDVEQVCRAVSTLLFPELELGVKPCGEYTREDFCGILSYRF